MEILTLSGRWNGGILSARIYSPVGLPPRNSEYVKYRALVAPIPNIPGTRKPINCRQILKGGTANFTYMLLFVGPK